MGRDPYSAEKMSLLLPRLPTTMEALSLDKPSLKNWAGLRLTEIHLLLPPECWD